MSPNNPLSTKYKEDTNSTLKIVCAMLNDYNELLRVKTSAELFLLS